MSDDLVTLIPFDDRAAWEIAAAGAMPSQSWGHAAGLHANGLIPELAVVWSQGATMLLPFHRRPFDDAADIATLPGLSGALITPTSAAPLAAWARFAQRQGWVCGYIQLSPENDALQVPAPDQIASSNSLYVIDLETWDIDASIGYSMRRKLKAGARAAAAFVTDPSRLAAAFPALYIDLLARAGGRAEFTDAALERWFQEPGLIAFGAETNGQIVNAQIGRRHGIWADFHLSGTTAQGRELQAWVIWKSIEALRETGVRFLNIGGYGAPGDGLHLAKSRFGAVEHPLRSLRQVYDPKRFSELCAKAGAEMASPFFPPYRAKRADPRPAAQI